MRALFLLAVATGCSFLAPVVCRASQHHKNEEPKSQVLPLPPEPPKALAADVDSLDFHISPVLTSGGLSAQIRESLNELIRDTRGETIIKLRAFVAGSGDPRRVQAQVIDLFSEHKLPLPVLSILQVGSLSDERAQVLIEAVVATHRKLNPDGLAFLFGQRGSSFEKALERLRASASEAGVDPGRVLAVTCFASRLEPGSAVVSRMKSLFPQAQIGAVQAQRDPVNDVTTCEAVAQLDRPPADGPVVVMDKTQTTLVHSPQLIFTALQLTFGRFLDDGQEAFSRLEKVAAAVQPVQTPVQVDGFALDPSAASALRKTIPLGRATFTVQDIEGLPAIDASAGIEAILAANVESAVVHKRSEDTIHR